MLSRSACLLEESLAVLAADPRPRVVRRVRRRAGAKGLPAARAEGAGRRAVGADRRAAAPHRGPGSEARRHGGARRGEARGRASCREARARFRPGRRARPRPAAEAEDGEARRGPPPAPRLQPGRARAAHRELHLDQGARPGDPGTPRGRRRGSRHPGGVGRRSLLRPGRRQAEPRRTADGRVGAARLRRRAPAPHRRRQRALPGGAHPRAQRRLRRRGGALRARAADVPGRRRGAAVPGGEGPVPDQDAPQGRGARAVREDRAGTPGRGRRRRCSPAPDESRHRVGEALMRTKTISRLRRAALAAAAAAVLASPARAEELEGPSRLAAPSPVEGPSRGETQPQRVVPPERVVPPDGPEGRLVMPKSAEENGMQIQPNTPDIYVIVKGDTLWDLSQKFLNNPWYWPKIWSLNAYIENPHWIYPGNKLKLIPGQGPQAPTQVEPEDERPQSEIANQVDTSPPEAADLAVVRKGSREFDQSGNTVSVSGKLAFKPPPVLTVHDSGLVTPEEMRQAGSLDASFEEKDMLSTFDTAYVRFPRGAEVNIGDRIILFRPEGDIVQPVTGRRLGTQTRSMGEAKVISVDGRLATVQITRTWEEIERGDLARPWTDQDLRVAPKPNSKEMRGVIVSAVRRGLTTLGESNEVFIDKGERDGVEVGNTFAVVRKGDGLHDLAVYGEAYNMGATGSRAAGVAVPYESVGLLLVVDVKDRLSTAVVVRSVKELRKGDVVEMHPQGSGGP